MLPSNYLPFLTLLTPAATSALRPRAAVNDWVTIDPSGAPHTLTPSVTTSDGAVRTLSGAPYLLTGSVFTVSSDGEVATRTGSPPPPEASATDGAGGLFAVCHNRVGKDGPFCDPRAGSDLSIGRTYYVTWDKTFFGDDTRDELVNITANYLPSGRRIMNAVPVPARQGYMPLTIRESFMLGQEVQKPVRLTMAYSDDGEVKEVPGPRINIVRADISVVQGAKVGRKGPHPAAVAVPVVLGVLVVGLGLWWLWRKKKDGLVLAGIRRRSGQGYGVGKSRAARAGKEDGIDLKESPASPSPRAGGNVFREEIERQDAER